MTDHGVEILLVEDNPSDVRLTLEILKEHDIARRVQVARDGAEALDFLYGTGCHAQRRIEDMPKIVLLDLKLPRVDGIETLQRIKADSRTQMIPVVVLSSSREDRDVSQSYRLGANSYVVKPLDFDKFVVAMRQIGFYWLLLNQAPVSQVAVASGRAPETDSAAMPVPLRVLLLEDRQEDALLMVEELHKARFELEWVRADAADDFVARLHSEPDVILADFRLPAFDALDALRMMRERGLDIPFIVVTGALGDEAAAQCIREGAADYLLKDRMARLGDAVKQALEKKRARVDQRRAEQALRRAHDDLEQRVSTRTGELSAANHKLKAEVRERARLQQVLADKVQQLEDALAQVKQLSGLLPICMYCKKIRDDQLLAPGRILYVAAHGCPVQPRDLPGLPRAGDAKRVWGREPVSLRASLAS